MGTTVCYLGVDVGTSSCKVIAIDRRGEVRAHATASYPLSTPKPTWVEQEPEEWVRGAKTAVAQVTDEVGKENILGIGLSGQMHGLVAMNRGGAVLRPPILWNDQRTERQCQTITHQAGGSEALLALTNNPMLPGYTGGKIVWLREEEPALFDQMTTALNPKDYLRYRLTGELATEVSDASGMGLFDVRERCWSRVLLDRIGLDPALLPRCHESHEVSGRVSRQGAAEFGLPADTPVVGGGGDAVIQTTGTGVTDPGPVQVTIGTAGIVAAALKSAVDNTGGTLQVFCNTARNRWHCMGVSQNAGGALQWLAALLTTADADLETLTGNAGSVAPGAEGLLFLPYLTGERCPYSDPRARGAFIGLTLRHGESELVRSVMEGVVFSLRDIFDAMSENGVPADEVRISGGGAASGVWRQILADVFGCPVVSVRGAMEGAAYGAAVLAGVGVGGWSSVSEAVSDMEIVTREEPRSDSSERYGDLYDCYRSLYGRLKPVFDRLSEG